MRKSNSMQMPEAIDNDDDDAIDFSNAVLYVGALQTIFATASASMISVLSCWLLPIQAISAVRTLVLSTIVSALLVRRPFRLGRVHGLGLVFNALRPCVAIYLASMVLEQLIHTCTRDGASPSWRRFVFHVSIVVAMLSGFARALKPLQQTDVPFLVTSAALFVIAMLPPPAVVLSGPLCSEPTLNSSIERLVRSLVFSFLYCTFVYASAPPVQSSGEVLVCVMRASAASLWTLGASVWLLPFAILQSGMVIYVRIYSFEYQIVQEEIPLVTENEHERDEENVTTEPISPTPTIDEKHQFLKTGENVISPQFSTFGTRSLVDISSNGVENGTVGGVSQSGIISQARLAEIAASIK